MDTKTLLESLSQRADVPKKDVQALLTTLNQIIGERCSDMDIVTLPGFGNFEAKKRLERVMVMPGTGKRMLLPPKMVLTFKPSAILKQKMKTK